LSQWLLWRKLEQAALAISTGASLAEAAHAGGFADQPHFSRTMRRMFGLTPGAAAIALR
jgi:AraC-like DNA-binding protein